MGDVSKAEKLAAARRKLKEFQNQQKNKENHCSSVTTPTPPIIQVPQLQEELLSHKQEVPILPPENEASSSYIKQQVPSIANYFQSSNKNEIFFDTVHKPVNGSSTNNFPTVSSSTQHYVPDNSNAYTNSSLSSAQTEIPPASSLFPSNSDSSFFTNSFTPNSLHTNVTEVNTNNHTTNNGNADELMALKFELQRANSKVKMQTDALDIITTEREDLQIKLTKALQEIDSYERNVRSLNIQLEENFNHQKQLMATLDELKHFKENASAKELSVESNLNDLKEKNDELYQSLKIEQEKNKTLQSQLEETQSNYSVLNLKFQQLGIETNNDSTKDYKSVHDECELWKSKYEELESRLKAMMYDKERTEEEYRQYIVNLKEQLENTNVELRRISDENQTLANKISFQTEHISGLERQLQKTSGGTDNEVLITELRDEIEKFRQKSESDEEIKIQLASRMADYEESQQKIQALEREIDNLKADMTNAQELQMAVESNKVAASQAIAQNTKLKNEFEQLHQMVQILNEEKIMLSQMLEEEKVKNAKLTALSQNDNKTNDHEIKMNDAAINTDAGGEGGENGIYGKANVEAMLLLQEKFKSVLDKMADLTDEKQQLEHLVTQLQCETETIEEYVALYQKQRSALQQRARETDLKMERVIEEKKRLLNILGSILTTEEFDCAFVKQLVENNLSVELTDELANRSIDTIGYHYEHTQRPFSSTNESAHHPSCPCCSGQLITV